ncbi:Cuticle-degrading protease [Dionaea muscipula]
MQLQMMKTRMSMSLMSSPAATASYIFALIIATNFLFLLPASNASSISRKHWKKAAAAAEVHRSPVVIPYHPPRGGLPPKITLLGYQFLAPHNSARSVLGIPPLTWDAQLASYAQSYANLRQHDCALIHSDGPYGENIFWGSGSDWTAGQAVMAWVAEKQYYDYYTNSCLHGQDCGHYTQIVWRSSARLGCARVVCSGGAGVFITCNYDPPGNYIGERPY